MLFPRAVRVHIVLALLLVTSGCVRTVRAETQNDLIDRPTTTSSTSGSTGGGDVAGLVVDATAVPFAPVVIRAGWHHEGQLDSPAPGDTTLDVDATIVLRLTPVFDELDPETLADEVGAVDGALASVGSRVAAAPIRYLASGTMTHRRVDCSTVSQVACFGKFFEDAQVSGLAWASDEGLHFVVDWDRFGPEATPARPRARLHVGSEVVEVSDVADTAEAAGLIGSIVTVPFDLLDGFDVGHVDGATRASGVLVVDGFDPSLVPADDDADAAVSPG